ncbi:MAG: 2,3-bisphosphoglycerate-independent phosphoglycerate mutase [Gemmatimonadaceae bacterium]|nr:2,3-bisphosphoglycerate-independent phosphoglycerate mutase [Gemmatimonadaceae bacterium]
MASDTSRPVALIVLDGWGYREETEGNAIALADTPTWDAIWKHPARTLLAASGTRVGLPEGQMGNSEVGHLNLGAGRVVMQDLVRISSSIAGGSFFRNPALVAACEEVKENDGTLHLMGLIGAGGVHAIDAHLFALIELAVHERVPRVAIHAFMDGRDTMPTSGLAYMEELLARIAATTGNGAECGTTVRIASVSGRYYAMDRDRRWQRTELAYRAVVDGAGPSASASASGPTGAIRASYDAGVTDEFMLPVVIVENDAPVAPMRDGDAVICFNYRSDRMRQIVQTLIDPAFSGFDVSHRPRVSVTTLTSYDRTFDLPVAFAPQSMARIVAEVLSGQGRTMLKTAETEKYPHVTYFFNGGREEAFAGEERILIPSQKVATYDLMPEMSAPGITDVLCRSIEARSHDFILCNYANADMVGHSGSMEATIKAVETVDACLARVMKAAKSSGTRLLITADHGNAEMMIDPATGGPHTAHTTSPVPIVALNDDSLQALRGGGALCDVGPTILRMMGIEQPPEMTGNNLGEMK